MNAQNGFYPSWVQRANTGGGKADPTGKTGIERLVALGGTVASEPIRDAKAIAAGFLGAYALANDGTVWSWGHNDFGQLGWGEQSTEIASRRIQAELEQGVSFPKWPAADKVRNLSDVVAVASKGLTAYALKKNGTVWAWGANDLGQLGRGSIQPTQSDGTLDYRISAEQVPNVHDVTSISAMGDTAFAVHRDGRVTAWGDNRNGEVGAGALGLQPSPTPIPGLTGVRAVAAGIDFAIAVVPVPAHTAPRPATKQESGGCYIATAVYGSYDAPPVMTLRRFRDQHLVKSMVGRVFVRAYYLLSPSAARCLGRAPLLSAVVKRVLDRLVARLDSNNM